MIHVAIVLVIIIFLVYVEGVVAAAENNIGNAIVDIAHCIIFVLIFPSPYYYNFHYCFWFCY